MSESGRAFKELRDSGLLWLINKSVFHPRGFSLSLIFDEEGEVTGWALMGKGDKPVRIPDEAADTEAERFTKVREEFSRHARKDDIPF